MRRLILCIGLELYAAALSFVQFLNGVHTDEAKYLLNIPYPHPPLARFILHVLDGFTYQEFFWRFVFASLCVQTVWLAIRLSCTAKPSVRIAVAGCWLLSAAILLQAGTIMMAPLTAIEASILIYWWLQTDDDKNNAGFIALFWLASLFTAYQAILFAPIAYALLRRQTQSWWLCLLYFLVPVGLLALYTLTNPLVPASILVHSGDAISPFTRLLHMLNVWLWGGSIFLSIVGLFGMVRYRQWPLFLSIGLIAAYVFLTSFDYYAILFLPLSMAGFMALVRQKEIVAWPVAMGVFLVSVYHCFLAASFLQTPGPARHVLHVLASETINGPILIQGNFGHDWQYESRVPLLRYTPALLPSAGAVICISACSNLDANEEWRQIMSTSPFVYVRRML